MDNKQRRWNHNIHYYDIVLNAVTPGMRTALDVGTGDGLLAGALAEKIPEVTGIDVDAGIIELARSGNVSGVTWITGDALTFPLPESHYDLVAAVASVHHFPDVVAGLRRLASLTAPGGTLVVIGCARSSALSDYLFDAVGVLQHQVLSRIRGFWQHNAPVEMELMHSYADIKKFASMLFPGMVWRRLPLWRYVIIWRKPE